MSRRTEPDRLSGGLTGAGPRRAGRPARIDARQAISAVAGRASDGEDVGLERRQTGNRLDIQRPASATNRPKRRIWSNQGFHLRSMAARRDLSHVSNSTPAHCSIEQPTPIT